MSKRFATLACALALTAAACSAPPKGEVGFGSGTAFVPQVADAIDDVGAGAGIAVNADGVPFVSYFGFPAVPKGDEIPVARPIGAPFVPGVLLASQQNGIWSRGAAAMPRDPPTAVSVPFGPATVETLQDASLKSVNGTDVAVDADGGLHVVWTGPDGIWYAEGSGSFTAEKVVSHLPSVSEAGPLGWASVAVDANGVPWVAATVTGPTGQEVVAATRAGDGWDVQSVATLTPCAGCPQPLRTEIGVTPDGPLVVYADPAADAVMVARPDGRTWTTQTIAPRSAGDGLSLAIDGDGGAHLAFYAGDGTVRVVSSSGSGWTSATAAKVKKGSDGGAAGTGASTGIAVDDNGKIYLTWVDPGTEQVLLASSDGGAFTPIETRATAGGRWPAVGVAPDGSSVFLAWYDPADGDLSFGTFGAVGDLVLAQPSPTTAASAAPPPAPACDASTVKPSADVTIVASPGAAGNGYDTDCVVVPAGAPFSLTFDNQDGDPGGIHNVSGFTDATAADQLFTSGAPAQGPEQQTVKVDALDAGSYYFHCDVHPTTMTGTLVVAKAKN